MAFYLRIILLMALHTHYSRGCRRFCRTTLNIVSQCAYPPLSRDQYITGRRNFPTIGNRVDGLSGVWFLLKNESCQNCVLTIPLCRGGRDEATIENRVEIERWTWPHAPTRRLATRADASHASSSPGWADPTRIPDDPTTWLTRIRMTSAWRNYDVSSIVEIDQGGINMPSQHLSKPRQYSGTHQPRHQPRAEPRDRI